MEAHFSWLSILHNTEGTEERTRGKGASFGSLVLLPYNALTVKVFS